MHRRSFLSLLGTASAATLLPGRAIAEIPAGTGRGYGHGIMIDSLGGPGEYFHDIGTPLSAAEINDVRASGLTAVNLTVGGPASYDETVRAIAYWNAEIAAHPDVFLLVRHTVDIAEAKRSGRLGLIYGFQDVNPFGEDLVRVDTFRDFGVRIFQLTYNGRNLVGDGCLEPGNAGLSVYGRKLLALLNERKALVDLAHSGERTALEAIEASTAPVAITHSCCAALAPHPRNKTDNELRKLADKGGYVGIYLTPFLRSQGQQMADDVIRHIEHAIDVCGEDHVGIGTDGSTTPVVLTPEYMKSFADFINDRRKQGISAPREQLDVYLFVPDLNRTDQFLGIGDLLSKRKHPDARIDKILGGNFNRLLKDVWQD